MTPTGHHESKIFYGWWVVLAAAIGLFLHYGPIIAFTFGVFLKPLTQEFGWSRAEISLAFSLATLGATLALPFIGQLVDRFGARKVIVPSVLLFGVCVASCALLSASLWHLYAIYTLTGITGSGTTPVPYSKVISHWFDHKRGLALGLAAAGSALGALSTPALAHALIALAGWREAYVLLSLLVVGVTVPVVAFFLKETPQLLGLWPDGSTESQAGEMQRHGLELGLTCSEAWHTGTFWLMVGTFFLMSVSVHGCIIHLAPLLTDRGLSTQSAALATSLLGGGILLGRIGAGYALDRFLASSVAVCFFCGTALGIALLWHGATGGLIFVAALLIGLGQGAEFDLMAYTISRYFGLCAFGEIYSYAFAAFGLGGVIGPVLMGAGFDVMGSYGPVLATFMVATLVAAGFMTRLGPYRVWEVAAEAA